MEQIIKNYISEQSMSHPDFPKMGLGNIAYMRKLLDRNHFVYTLTAANGECLLEKQSWDTVHSFVIEHDLELVTLH